MYNVSHYTIHASSQGYIQPWWFIRADGGLISFLRDLARPLSHCGTWHGIWKIPIRWKWSPISNLRFHAFQRDYRVSRLRMIRIRLPSSMTLASLRLLQTTSSILLSSIWMSMCIFFAPHSHPETILLDPLARSRYPILKKISRHSSIFVFKKGSASDQKKGSSSGCDKRAARGMVRMGNSCYEVGCVFLRE